MSVSTDITCTSTSQSDSVDMVETEDDGEEVDAEYLTQYFGFQPQSFINGMYNAVLENIKEAMTTLNEAVLNTYKDKISEAELHEVTRRQGQMTVEKLDKLFDKVERYLNCNVFCLPKNLTLPEDRLQVESPCSEKQMKDLDTKLKEVKDRIIGVRYANSVLREKVSETDKMQTKLDTVLDFVQKCHNKVKEESRSVQASARDTDQVVETIKEFDTLVQEQT